MTIKKKSYFMDIFYLERNNVGYVIIRTFLLRITSTNTLKNIAVYKTWNPSLHEVSKTYAFSYFLFNFRQRKMPATINL